MPSFLKLQTGDYLLLQTGGRLELQLVSPTPEPSAAVPNTIAAAFVDEYVPPKKKKKRLRPAPEIIQEFKVLNDRLGRPTRIVYQPPKVWTAEDDEEDLLTIMQLLESMHN